MLTSHFVVIGDLQSPVSCHKECLLMIRLEDNIRDFLAEHLEMLEEGLRLSGKNFACQILGALVAASILSRRTGWGISS